MQLKQTYSKYYGWIEEEMKGSLNEDPEFERAHQEKDVLKLLTKDTEEHQIQLQKERGAHQNSMAGR